MGRVVVTEGSMDSHSPEGLSTKHVRFRSLIPFRLQHLGPIIQLLEYLDPEYY